MPLRVECPNFGMATPATQCLDYKAESNLGSFHYHEWGCAFCEHLLSETDPPLGGKNIAVRCAKGHRLLAFIAKERDQKEEI